MRKKVLIALRMAGIAGQEKLAGIFRFLGEGHDWDITLVRTAAEFTPSRMRAALVARYDGLILSIPNTERTTRLLAGTNTPTVVLDIHDPSFSARTRNIAFIRNSPEEIGRAASDFLLSTGRCRSYAFMQNPSIAEWSVDRFKAFKEALRDRGFWCHELATPAELKRLARPVGVFAANDDCGFKTLEYCRTHRLRVPEDVLVLGTNNDTLICENCHPTLSSIQPDFNEEGYLAAKVLTRLMSAHNAKPETGSQKPETCFVGVKTIVRRGSTAEVSQAGKLVQKAVAFVRKNALRGITVEDVAKHLGCSRRLADLRFRELQGNSIGKTILTIRLEEAKRLLKSTHDSIDKIAADCGYENTNSLRNLFKRRFGLTMREYRQPHKGKPQ